MLYSLRSHYRYIAGVLFVTFGALWLSLAVVPNTFAISLDDSVHSHNPCNKWKSDSHGYRDDQKKCGTCDVRCSVLKSVDNFYQPTRSLGVQHQAVIFSWCAIQFGGTGSVSFKIIPPLYPPIQSTLQFRVLLI